MIYPPNMALCPGAFTASPPRLPCFSFSANSMSFFRDFGKRHFAIIYGAWVAPDPDPLRSQIFSHSREPTGILRKPRVHSERIFVGPKWGSLKILPASCRRAWLVHRLPALLHKPILWAADGMDQHVRSNCLSSHWSFTQFCRMSLQSAIMGFLICKLLAVPITPQENVVVQTTAVATGTVRIFKCVSNVELPEFVLSRCHLPQVLLASSPH
jgi:hypothetical protein